MAAPSSSAFLPVRAQNEFQLQQQQQQLIMPPPPPPPPPPAQPQPTDKKRRNQPGNPNPDAEVIALTPETLMATNRFVCEVCQKGFQREQNLQLHRRGHNLPWKLKKSTQEVKRKVYICPEPTCVHHDPTRALGDLTGIKKHYSRKHGEKKFKCEKCKKKYAVQSDCKAHSKTCGTREYKCHCGTIFSRRDSFVTHRAFCDALAQEGASTQSLNAPLSGNIGSHLFGLPHTDHQINYHHQLLSNQDLLRLSRLDPQFKTLVGPGFGYSPSPQGLTPSASIAAALFLNQHLSNHEEGQSQHEMQLPQIQMNNANCSSSSTSGLLNLGFFPGGSNAAGGMAGGHHPSCGDDSSHFFSSGNLMSMAIPSLYSTSMNPIQTPTGAHMSATTLLQKAAQSGSTTTTATATSPLFQTLGKSSSSDSHSFGVFEGNHLQPHLMHHDLLNSMTGGGSGASSASIYGGLYSTDYQNHDHDQHVRINDDDANNDYGGFPAINHIHNNISFDDHSHHQQQHQNSNNYINQSGFTSGFEQGGRLTRDFLGMGEIVMNAREQHNGVEMSALDRSQEKSSTSQSHNQSFGGGSF